MEKDGKTPSGRRARSQRAGFTLIEIMIVIAVVSIILMMALPGWIHARRKGQQNVCQENLSQIDGAKHLWAMQNNKGPDEAPDWADLVGEASYLRRSPQCPADGAYTLNPVSQEPTCSLSDIGHAMP